MSNSQSVHLVCPQCAATNRIPAQRMSESPVCGKCQQALLTAAPVVLTGQTAHKTIQKQASAAYGIRSLPTMVAFKGGKEVARQSGALPRNQIVQWVQSLA